MGYQWAIFLMLTIGSAGILGMSALFVRRIVRVSGLSPTRLMTAVFVAFLVLVWAVFTIAAAIPMVRSLRQF